MEKQNLIQCSNCKTWNNRNAEFCFNCGERLTAFAGDWWKSNNMRPVRLAKLRKEKRGTAVADYLLSLFVTIVLFYLSVGVAFLFYEVVPYICGYGEERYELWNLIPSTIVAVIFGLSLLWFWFRYFLSSKLAPNWLRKRKKELLDDDFIENYDDRRVHYVFVARGTGTDHKFGLFDVQKIKLTVPFEYDSLKWQEQGETLLAVKDGIPMIIDVNGNKYQ